MSNIKPNLAVAIKAINPEAKFSYTEVDGIDVITWYETTPISDEDINSKLTELQAEYDALAYARARELAYPITKEFIEAYTEKEIGGDSTKWDTYVVKYNKVRSDNPKP
jgi:hypothetical protein